MSNIVFILGAGASHKAGAPLMRDFLDVAKTLLLTGKVKTKEDHFKRVFQAIGQLQAVFSKSTIDLTNIESIFNAFEIATIIQKLPGFKPEEIPVVIASLKELIVQTLQLSMPFPVRGSHIGVPEPYQKFAKLIEHLRSDALPSQSVALITFNYDIAADTGLFRQGLPFDYGINTKPSYHNAVPLLKLHGSLNWATMKADGAVCPLLLEEYFQHYRPDHFAEGSILVPIGSQLYEFFSEHKKLEVESEPLIVPPTWNKADHYHALSKVWALAARHLGEAEYIFIIGYSLPETDAFFKLLYAIGTIGPNPLTRITVYNPDESGVVDKRFRELLGSGSISRYDFQKLKFEQAIDHIKQYFPSRK